MGDLGYFFYVSRWYVEICLQLTPLPKYAMSGIFCGFSKNDGFMPINKNLWTTSFAFVTAGGGLVCLSVTYVLVDVLKVWTGR